MSFLPIYNDLVNKGQESSPRGQKILELENYSFSLAPRERFTSYRARNFNLDYAKFEMLWYLTGDKFNDMITRSASMWSDLRQVDGSWLSNYGQYWFGKAYTGFDWVMNSLISDKDSRQAVIPMLSKEHLFPGNKDIVCTYSVGFRIRNNRLNMSVNMRSQDAMWGMTNDVFCFSVLHEMVYVALRDTKYDELKMGRYSHKVDSLHVYERHFDMLHQIFYDGETGFYQIGCPEIYDHREVLNLMDYHAEDARGVHEFTEWLHDNKYSDKR